MTTRLVQQAPAVPLPQVKTTQPIEYKSFIEFFKANIVTYLNPAASQPSFTNGGAAMGDVISDWSWLIRVMMPEGAVTQLMGCPTPENLFRGTLAAVKAWGAYKRAHLVDDKQGMLEAGLDTFRGVVQSLGGGFYLAYRTLTGIADIKHVNTALNATTPLGKAAYITGMIGNVLFLVLFAVFGGMGLASFYNSASFRMDLKACKKDEELLAAFLKKKCDVDPSSKFEKYKTPEQIRAYKEKCANSALDVLTDVIYGLKQSEEPGEALPSKEEVRESLKDLLTSGGKPNNPDQADFCRHLFSSMGIKEAPGWDFSPLELMGFKIEVTKRQHRKQIKLDRVGAGKVSKAFAKGLSERLSEGSPEVKAAARIELKDLKEETLDNNKIGLVVASSLIIVGALGVAASVIGLFPVLSPVMLMSLIVLTLLVCVGMYGADTFFMKMGWSNGEPGRYDKHYVAFEAGMLVTMMAVSVGVTLGFGLPILPLILAVVFGAIGLGLCGITWDELSYKELKYFWEHPTLENFPQMLNKILSPESLKYSQEEQEKRIKDLFHNLKKEDRDAIRERFVTLSKTEAFKHEQSRDLYAEYSKGKLAEKDLDRFVRGVKKTRNYFWKEWSENKAAGNQKLAGRNRKWALQAEAVYTRAKNGEKMAALQYDKAVFERLREDLKYLTARESDATKLRDMAHYAISKRAMEAKQAQKLKVALSDALPGLKTA
jgi:hypothetical protein